MTVNEYNYAQLRQARDALAETAKHNRALEGVEWGKLGETQRHQLASENIERAKIDVDRAKVDETIRHDSEMERIQNESNRITAGYNRGNLIQNARKLAQTAETTRAAARKDDASADKTLGEASLLYDYFRLDDRKTDAEIWSKYRNANAAETSADARMLTAKTQNYNSKLNTVLGVGQWITGTISGGLSKMWK